MGGYINRGFDDLDWLPDPPIRSRRRPDPCRAIASRRGRRHDGRLRRRRRDAGQRALPARRQGRRARGRPPSPAEDFVNDEWRRSTSSPGSTTARPGHLADGEGLPEPPAWTCKMVGGTTDPLGRRCPRFQEHEFRAVDVRRDGGRNLLDWPITLADMEPYYDRAETRSASRNQRHPAPAGEQQLQGVRKRRAGVGYTNFKTGPYGRTPSRVTGGRRRSRTASTSRATSTARSGRRWSPSSRRPRDGPARPAAGQPRRPDHARRLRAGSRRGLRRRRGRHQRQRARAVVRRGNSIESRGSCSTRRRAFSPTAWRTRPARWAATTCAT